jgi:hypothetical protein
MDDEIVERWLSTLRVDGMYASPGYLKPWYFMLRAFEEITRSKRYERPVTLLAITTSLADASSLEAWISTRLRAMDLVCKDDAARYFVLLPETTADGASDLVRRLSNEAGPADVAMATLPREVERFAELVRWTAVDANREAA